MIWLVLIVVFILLVISPLFRCAFFHPCSLSFFGIKDLFLYARHHEGDRCRTGELVAYTGLFGKGKTLSAVHRVVSAYRRFNGKKVWCPRRKKLVKQRIKVISNVALDIPYNGPLDPDHG